LVPEYANYSQLLELKGRFLLTSTPADLRVLLDSGASNNFINHRLAESHHLSYDPSLAELIETGDGNHSVNSYGETKPLKMKLGSTYTHTSSYTVMDLGEYDVILGMPWVNHSKCQVQGDPHSPKVQVIHQKRTLQLPLRVPVNPGKEACYSLSKKEFSKEAERGFTELYEVYYQGWKPEEESTPTKSLLTLGQSHPPPKGGPLGPSENRDPLASPSGTHHNPRLDALLKEFQDVFPDDLPKNVIVEREIAMRIPVQTGVPPPCQAPYRASADAQVVIEETLKYLYDHGFCRDSLSEYGAPVTMARKQDGSWRFCIDYRKLNAITKEAKYPLPRIEDCLDRLGKAKFFSKLDLRSGYWQVKIHPDDIEKTAFRTQNGHHEFLVMPFGLQGAPSTFQRLMNHYLRHHLGKFVLVYLDDICIYSNTEEEHYDHLKVVLQILREKQLYAKSTKCDFLKKRISFLGYFVEGGSISTDPEKISAVKKWPPPMTVRELSSFLGLANFYRKFVEKYAEKAKALTNILKSTEFQERFGHKFTKTAAITLGEPELKSFQELKDGLTEAPCLLIYDPDRETEVWADASSDNQTIGAVLMQEAGQGMQPVAFLSKVLDKHEKHYPTFEMELLGLKIALEQWRSYLPPLQFVA